MLLQKEIEHIHGEISAMEKFMNSASSPQARATNYNFWSNVSMDKEVELEKFAHNLGLVYERRHTGQFAGFYYKTHGGKQVNGNWDYGVLNWLQ